MAYKLLYPFLNERVRDMIVVHDTIESLHENVDRTILPKEFGGTAGGITNEPCVCATMSMADYFQDLKRYIFKK